MVNLTLILLAINGKIEIIRQNIWTNQEEKNAQNVKLVFKRTEHVIMCNAKTVGLIYVGNASKLLLA